MGAYFFLVDFFKNMDIYCLAATLVISLGCKLRKGKKHLITAPSWSCLAYLSTQIASCLVQTSRWPKWPQASTPTPLIHFEKGFRSFHPVNIGSAGQRAAKLPAFKVGGFPKSLPLRPYQLKSVQVHSAWVWIRPGSNHSQNLMDGNFAALWLTDSKVSALKDLNPFQTVQKFQEASSILMVDFAMSNRPHLHRAY